MLGTSIRLTVESPDGEAVCDKILQRLSEIEQLMSVQIDNSEVNRINALAGISPVAVSESTWTVVTGALRIAEASDGAFDPTIGPLVDAWAIGSDHPRIPEPAEIAALRLLVDWKAVRTDSGARTVFLEKTGMKMDLGGIAKGYAADEAVRIATENGVRSGIMDLGGNLYVMGSKTDSRGKSVPWSLGIQRPDATRGEILGVLQARNCTLVTSGDYERFFEADGVRYHHIIDPRTGYPARSGLVQAGILSPESSMTCDGLSTAVFILGMEKGLALLDKFPGFSGLLVDKDHHVIPGKGFPVADFSMDEEATAPDAGYVLESSRD